MILAYECGHEEKGKLAKCAPQKAKQPCERGLRVNRNKEDGPCPDCADKKKKKR